MSLVRKQYRRQEDDVEEEFGDVIPEAKKLKRGEGQKSFEKSNGPAEKDSHEPRETGIVKFPSSSLKSCAPEMKQKGGLEEQEKSPKAIFPDSSPFIPLPILYPSIYPPSHHNLPLHSHEHLLNPGNHDSRAKKTGKRAEDQISSFSSWYPFNSSLHGPLLSHTPDITSAIEYTAQKGIKPSRVAKKPLFRPSPLQSHSKAITSLKWHPSAGSLLLSSSLDGSVKLWDTMRSTSLVGAIFEKTGGINLADFSEDGRHLFYGGYGKHICQVDVETGKETMRVQVEGEITSLQNFERNFVLSTELGSILSLDSRDASMIKKWLPTNTEKDKDGKFAKRIQGIPGRISSFSFLPGASSPQVMVTSDPQNAHDAEHAVTVWDWNAGRPISTGLWISPFAAFYCKPHPSLHQIAVLNSSEHPIQVYSATHPFKKKKKSGFLSPNKNSTFRSQIDFSPDGTLVYLGSSSGQVYVYQYDNSKLLTSKPIFEANEPIASLAHHPILNTVVAYGSWHGQISVHK
jgi:WD40 repeat protein